MNATAPVILEHQPIPTWFGIGGGADRLATAATSDDIRACLELDPGLRILGDGANLLVDDDGVGELVVRLTPSTEARRPSLPAARGDDPVIVRAHAGLNLPTLILETVRAGLGGLQGLGGIPASVGGAVIMNAGGAFGEIGASVSRVHAVDRRGAVVMLDRAEIPFAYRRSGLEQLIVVEVELTLTPADPEKLRRELVEVMNYKKASQPMASASAGCVFKNPILASPLPELASLGWTGETAAGARVSAGFLLDRAGCKGLSVGGASVSERHANFIVTGPGAKAREVITLMGQVAGRVADRFGVTLHREVVVWERSR